MKVPVKGHEKKQFVKKALNDQRDQAPTIVNLLQEFLGPDKAELLWKLGPHTHVELHSGTLLRRASKYRNATPD